MPWIHAPHFLFVRRPKNPKSSWTGDREVVQAFRTSSTDAAARWLDEKRQLGEHAAAREGKPPYFYELYRLVKGGGYGGQYDAVPHPHGFEITEEGRLHFWCLPYHHTYHVDKIEGDVPHEVVEKGADAVERYIMARAVEAIQSSAEPKTATDEEYRHVRKVFDELQERR